MNEKQMQQIVEQYIRQSDVLVPDTKVTRVPDYKTVYVEQINGDGRSIVLTEYKVDGKTYWAGYSTYSQTVFLSRA